MRKNPTLDIFMTPISSKKISSLPLLLLTAVLALAALPTTADAQATRTWVSATGDDANPCSRTAPCKTFAGAISKTAAGGEISVQDPGGFGALTITKSISIIGDGTLAGALASGVNSFVINAAAGDHVVLRNLDIEGTGSGINGIRMIGGGTLVVDKCRINNFNSATAGAGNGIDFQPSLAGAKLIVTDCSITHNTAGSGIVVRPTASGATATIEKTQLINNNAGLRVEAGAVTAQDVVSSSNTAAGFNVISGGQANLSGCVASNNQIGVRALGGTIRISDTTVTNNTADGLTALSGGTILSFQNNRVAGNNPDGVPTGVLTLK